MTAKKRHYRKDTSGIHNPGGWLVVEGNRVLGRFKVYGNAMRKSRRHPDSMVVSKKSWS